MEIEVQSSNSTDNIENNWLIYKIRQQMSNFKGQIPNNFQESQIQSSNSMSQTEQQNKQIENKNAIIKSKKRQKKVCLTFSIPLKFKESDVYHVFGDLCISADYQIRIGGSLGWTQLGFDNLVAEAVQKYNDFVDVRLRFNKIQSVPLNEVIQGLQKIPDQTYYQMAQVLKIMSEYLDKMKAEMMEYNEANQEKYDDEFYEYNLFCLEKAKELMKEYNLSSYCIGRANYKDGSLDVNHVGYSNGLLNLLGLDYEIIQQMCLRDRQIQQINNLSQMLKNSLICLENRFSCSPQYKTRINIRTLDGYDLWIDLIYNKFSPPQYKGMFGQFFFYFIEIDIDANQIKGLLDFRNSIYTNNLNFDSFLQKELLFFTEDIEYSILSQSFMEKYYQNQIQKIQEQLNNSKQCGFRLIC